MAVPKPLLIPFSFNLLTIGSNNQAINKPINKGNNNFKIVKINGNICNSFKTLIPI